MNMVGAPGNHSREELETMLQKMTAASNIYYGLATQTGCHAFIEVTGFLNEFIKICQQTLNDGIDFAFSNTHSETPLTVFPYNAAYLGEKLDCIIGPVLRAEPAVRSAFFDALEYPDCTEEYADAVAALTRLKSAVGSREEKNPAKIVQDALAFISRVEQERESLRPKPAKATKPFKMTDKYLRMLTLTERYMRITDKGGIPVKGAHKLHGAASWKRLREAGLVLTKTGTSVGRLIDCYALSAKGSWALADANAATREYKTPSRVVVHNRGTYAESQAHYHQCRLGPPQGPDAGTRRLR